MSKDRTIYIVTKSADRLKFEDIPALPSQGGALTTVNLNNLDFAISTFSNYCAGIEAGCVQIFDAVDQREFGYFHI
jgi:hypothetical protein